MRVTFVLPQATLAGGVRVCAIYAEHLQRAGHAVSVVSTPWPDPSLKQVAKNLLKGQSIRRQEVGPSHFDGLAIPHHVIDRFRPVTDADVPDADVVVATWWETAEWVAALSPRKGAKVHLVQHDETQIPGQPTARVEATWRLPGFLRVAVAQWLADLGRDRYGVADVELVNNGVDLAQFHAPPRGKQHVPTVGVMYATVPFKGCDVALEAVALARKSVPGLRLLSFGSEEPTAALPLPEPAEFVCRPPQEKIREVYAACDAWLFASRCEGFGLPILEAMACRTPVLGTPTGAAPELIGHGGGGLLVKPQDAFELAKAIERIGRLPEADWRRMSDAALATAQANTWEASARRFESLLLDAAATRTTSPRAA